MSLAGTASLGRSLLRTLVPTPLQALWSLLLSAAILIISQGTAFMQRLGIRPDAVDAVSRQFHDHFDGLLKSAIVSNIALIAFWATVGLVAYLVWWVGYNLIVEARNEVTIDTEYTNRGTRNETLRTAAIKLVAGLGLVLVVAGFHASYSLWTDVFRSVLQESLFSGLLWALLAVGVFALHLYLALAMFQLTVTPWYHADALEQ